MVPKGLLGVQPQQLLLHLQLLLFPSRPCSARWWAPSPSCSSSSPSSLFSLSGVSRGTTPPNLPRHHQRKSSTSNLSSLDLFRRLPQYLYNRHQEEDPHPHQRGDHHHHHLLHFQRDLSTATTLSSQLGARQGQGCQLRGKQRMEKPWSIISLSHR